MEIADNLTVIDLKEILRKNSAATTGNKAESLARLMAIDDYETIVQEWLSKKKAARRSEVQTTKFESMKIQISELRELLKSITLLLTNKNVADHRSNNAADNQSTAGQRQNQQRQQ